MQSPVYMDHWRARGFTTVELLVVIVVLAVLAALAGPSMLPLLERWRVRQAVEELTATYAFARSEAIRRAGPVSVARSTSDTTACPLPADTADWRCGWTVFVDANHNGVQDAGEATLRVSPAASGVSVTHLHGGGAAFTLSRWGESTAGAVGFAIAATRAGSSVVRAFCADGGGRVRARQGVATCT